ncbi:winged helix-turn-helix transcriptional regulator [Sphingomonas pituitosa]|uniref:winged helix-turn-helix transcriptional regulator n=1 Tax=Sphingomonas pituitosa TaxID=99597 RepID=UPI00082DCC7A|nr:helix-turn-helix domain-containing protein [Sphingomonas pituitosa]
MKLENITKAKRRYEDACGTALALEFVGERWALLILRELLLGPRRFGEIRAGLPGLSANVLSQRLAGLEADGIVVREKLPPPASVQVYALTPWGYEAEPVILAMGRWALRSPQHDPSLPFSRVSLMLALRMLMLPDRAAGWAGRIGFRLGEETYLATIADGAFGINRGTLAGAEAVFVGEPNDFLPVLFGTMPLPMAIAEGRFVVEGDLARAAAFAALFLLPPKIGS